MSQVHFGAESLSEEQREAVCAACVKNACACLAADDPLLEALDWTALGLEDEHMEEVAAALQSNTKMAGRPTHVCRSYTLSGMNPRFEASNSRVSLPLTVNALTS